MIVAFPYSVRQWHVLQELVKAHPLSQGIANIAKEKLAQTRVPSHSSSLNQSSYFPGIRKFITRLVNLRLSQQVFDWLQERGWTDRGLEELRAHRSSSENFLVVLGCQAVEQMDFFILKNLPLKVLSPIYEFARSSYQFYQAIKPIGDPDMLLAQGEMTDRIGEVLESYGWSEADLEELWDDSGWEVGPKSFLEKLATQALDKRCLPIIELLPVYILEETSETISACKRNCERVIKIVEKRLQMNCKAMK